MGATAKQSSREIYFQIQAFVETPVKVTIELNLIPVPKVWQMVKIQMFERS